MSKRLLPVFSFVFMVNFNVLSMSYDKGSLEYIISMPRPQTHYFEVEVRLKNYGGDFVEFKLPVWTPGSYLVREYAKNVEGFTAANRADRSPVPFTKTSKSTWRVEHRGIADLVVKYSVYSFEETVRMSFLDEDHAFIMSNTLLMYIDDLKETSSILRLNVPEQWKEVSTTLTEIKGQTYAYYVPNYDILVDSPIEIGNHEVIAFTASGVPHEIAMCGRANYNSEKLKRDFTKIVESATAIFDDNPNEKYVFIIHNAGRGQGGLEHLSSTVLGVRRDAYNNDKSYNNFLSLVAHEYFHLWLVKRVKPVELEVLDYEREMYTDLLWVMEGFTSYFEEKIMLRAGLFDEKQFLENLLTAMSNIQNLPGASVQSVVESSYDAWIKAYRKNENSQNSQVSYYSKGMLLGALLDLHIIQNTNGEKSLDDVVNYLYYQFYKKKGKGITANDIKKVAEKTGNANLYDFFNECVYGTANLDNEKYLHYAGIGLVETNKEVNSKYLGISFADKNGHLMVNSVFRGSAAYDCGLNAGDELIAIDGYRLSAENISSVIDQFKVSEKVKVLYNRDGLVNEKELEIRRDDKVAYTYEILDNRTRQQETVFNAWLRK
jgi:predicted metalloprotease with PDZ domain